MNSAAPRVALHARAWRPWISASGVVALLAALPVASLAVAAARGSDSLWDHLLAYVLPAAMRDTLVLLAGVGVLAAAIGTSTAWLVTAFDFRGRRVFEWALLLPLAVPTYVISYAYLDILHPVGPVQNTLRAVLGYDSPRDFRLPEIRSMTGCILLLGFVLFPYVYLATRAMFMMQAANLVEVARTLGAGHRELFLRVAVPLARPALASGVILVLLETLNDIGASEFLGVRTLTVSIYSTWVTRSDLAGAAQLTLAMVSVIVVLVLAERYVRRQRRYTNDAQHPRPLVPQRLYGAGAVGAWLVCATPVAIGFLIPASYLVHAVVVRVRAAGVGRAILDETLNTLALSAVATVLTVACGIVVAYATRVHPGRASGLFSRTASIGYALPGTVLAIGILPVITSLDALIDGASLFVRGTGTGLLLLGAGVAVVYAYMVRFLTLAVGGVEAGLTRISPSLDDAARTLGRSVGHRLWHIHLPLLRPAVAAAALLVFVDCMKELPATLLLRPLGVETLATHLYGEAARGTYEDGAVAALLIVLTGLLPVAMLARIGRP